MSYFPGGEGEAGGREVLSYLKGPAQIGKPSTTSSQVRPLLLVARNFNWSPSRQTILKTIFQTSINWERASLTDVQGQRSHIASYNGFGPLNILGETSSPGKAEGAAAPLPRSSLSTGLRNHCSSELRLREIKSLKGERLGKGNSKWWSTVKTVYPCGMFVFTHNRGMVKRDGLFPVKE